MTKFERVGDSILRRIESGSLREGDRLPSEEQLATQFHVSVGTVQKALDRLARSELITREHGRGTFVSGALTATADVSYLRFCDEKGTQLPNFIHLRSVKRLRRGGPWSDFLGPGAEYVRIERRINVGGKTELHSEFWLREPEYARLGGSRDRHLLEKNLRVLLGQKLALPTLRIDQWLRFAALPAPVSRDLGLKPDEAGLVMEMRGYTLRDRPLFYHRVMAGPFALNLMIVR
ncbi:MAG: GntR family transcriptional regulator [Usitatibacter sp.]